MSGAVTFARLLESVEIGDSGVMLGSEIESALVDATRAVLVSGARSAVTIVVSLKPSPLGGYVAQAEVKVRLPKPPARAKLLWIDPDSEMLIDADPEQGKLPAEETSPRKSAKTVDLRRVVGQGETE